MKNAQINMGILFWIRGIIIVSIFLLLLYPVFGGELVLLGGIFSYFSYFLAAIFLIIYAIIHYIVYFKQFKILAQNRKTSVLNLNYFSQELVLLIFLVLSTTYGLLQGNYLFAPAAGVFLISVYFYIIVSIVSNPSSVTKFYCGDVYDGIKVLFLFLALFMLILGNQPFEKMGIPVAESLLLVVCILEILNLTIRQRHTK